MSHRKYTTLRKDRDILSAKGHMKPFYNKIFKNSCNETQLCCSMQISPGNIYGNLLFQPFYKLPMVIIMMINYYYA